jgi:MFS superfamily sulfate permease-like transporter
LSSLFAATLVLALLAFGATLLRHVPEAALGGVLLFVALRIIRLRQIVTIYRQSLGEFLLVIATAAAIIVLPIEQGVAVGIGLSLLHGIWSTTRARLVTFEHLPDTTIWWPVNTRLPGEQSPGIAVVGLPAPLTFLNAENFCADMMNVLKSANPKLLVLEASGILEIDFTAAQALLELIGECDRQGVTLAIARLESTRAQEAFERFGIYDRLPKERVFRSVHDAVGALGNKS